jgi:hypothetical protein
LNCKCSSTEKERLEAVLEDDAEMVARSEITSDGCSGVGKPMGGAAVEEEELEDVHAGESI